MSGRFIRPSPGDATPVLFPTITRTQLSSGLSVWAIPYDGVPVVAVSLVVLRGTGDDPVRRHGLASLTGDLLDEGAGSRDAIALAEAFGRLGSQLEVDVSPDATLFSFSGLARMLPQALALVADVIMRPRLAPADFARVRELRMSRLRQLSRSASTMADRAYVSALFGDHAYGHGALGTTASLEAITIDDARTFWSRMFGPGAATLIVSGAVSPAEVAHAAEAAFDGWVDPADEPGTTIRPDDQSDPRILLVDRPDAPQSELRVGHMGPARSTSSFHALVVLNAVLGGQFTSRINRRLREEKGVTYGARTSFDFRRLAGTFACDTSVQADATAGAVADVLEEFAGVGRAAVTDSELAAAKASLTRGYVRSFETAAQLTRAAAQLMAFGLPDNTFDRFVPSVEAITAADVHDAAQRFVRPADATVVVVGDAARCRPGLEELGRTVVAMTPEF